MSAIKIVRRPSGEAPDWVRDAWIGLTLPLRAYRPWVLEYIYGEVTRRPHLADGWKVRAMIAIELLAEKDEKAADWWKNNTPYFHSAAIFTFDTSCCVVV